MNTMSEVISDRKSFRQLFLDAEAITENRNNIGNKLTQKDTSFFDESAISMDVDSDRKLKFAEPGITTLLKQTYKIRQDKSVGKGVVKKVVINSDIFPSRGLEVRNGGSSVIIPLAHEVPYLNWESVVQLLISEDGPKGHHTALSMVPIQQLRLDNIAPPFCFDPDIVSVGEAFGFESDPLDTLIPNLSSTDDAFNMDPCAQTADEKECSKNTVWASSTAGADNNANTKKDNIAQNTNEVTKGDESLSKEERDRLMMEEKVKRITNLRVGGGEAAAAAVIFRTQGAKRPRDDIPKARNRFKAAVSALNHALIASTHRNTKMDLSVAELRNFHRPRMPKMLKSKEWQISILSPPKKKDISSTSTIGRLGSIIEPLMDVDKQDLSLVRGDFICIEYVEEHPPILLNVGMASAVLNYYRSNDHRDAEELTQRRRCEELEKAVTSSSRRVPRHVQLLLQQRSQKLVYDNTANMPRLEFGETKVLTPDDEAPFLGDVEEGEIIQALVNNIFRAPIFPHRPQSTDFLLVRLKQSNKAANYVVREIPRVFVCGQLEPQKIVPRPSRSITKLQEKMLILAASRYFRATPHGVSFQTVKESLLKFYSRKACFHGAQGLVKIIRDRVAEEVPVDGERRWFPKPVRGGPNGEKMTDELEKLEKDFSPEDVCMQESCNAAEMRLMDCGIGDIELPRLRLWLERMRRLKDFKIDRAAHIKRFIDALKKEVGTAPTSSSSAASMPSASSTVIAARFASTAAFTASTPASLTTTQQIQAAYRLSRIIVSEIRQLEEKIEIAQHVYERLLSAPWNTTEAFIRSQLERDGNGRIELTGQGDPSGRGEGFAYVRLIKQAGAAKKTSEKLVHTDKDLRKLTRSDLHRLLRGFGLTDADIKSLKRWDMVHLVREHSTKAESRGISAAMHKYARSATGQFLNEPADYGEAFKQRCQEIWDRQKCALAHFSHGYRSLAGGARVAEAEDDDEFDDDDDDWGSQLGAAEDINRTIVRRAAKLQEEEDSRRRARQAAQEKEEQRELSALRGTSFFASLGAGNASSATEVSSSSSSISSSALMKSVSTRPTKIGLVEPPLLESLPPHPIIPAESLPRRVVKQVIRTVADDGTEMIEVRFLLSASEVRRVEKQKVQQQREREQRSIEEAIGAGADVVFDDEEDILKASVADLKIKLPSLKRQGARNEDDDDDEHVPGRSRQARTSSEDYVAGVYKPPARTTARASLSIAAVANHRMPHVRFAAKLEKELMSEWRRPHAYSFHLPVPHEVLGYYEKIASPICLADIREKIASYQYSTVQAVINDLDLLVANAESFNGVSSKIAKHARSLRASLALALTHDKNHLGADKDEFSILENAIRKKNALWHRTAPSALSQPRSASAAIDPAAAPTIAASSSMPARLREQPTTAAATVRLPIVAGGMSQEGPRQGNVGRSLSNSDAMAMAMAMDMGDGSDQDSSSGDEEVLEEG